MRISDWVQTCALPIYVFLGHGPLVLVKAGVAASIGKRLVLKVAFAALIADRAIERVVDEEELHHPFPRLLHLFRCGGDGLAVGCRKRATRLRLGRPRSHFHQAHPAVARSEERLVGKEWVGTG